MCLNQKLTKLHSEISFLTSCVAQLLKKLLTRNRKVLSHFNPIHALTACICDIHFNIILPHTLTFPNWSSLFKFSNQNFVCTSHLPSVLYLFCPSHLPWFNTHKNTNCIDNIILSFLILHILRSKYSTQHFVLTVPQSMSLLSGHSLPDYDAV